MALDIRCEPTPSKAALRDLIVASLDSFLASATVLDAELSCSGSPILAFEAASGLTLISFDPEDGIEALLTGLSAWQETCAGTPWLKRLYPQLGKIEGPLSPRLVVLMPTLPPGIDLITSDPNRLQIFCFRVLLVNGQAALLIEPANQAPTPAAAAKLSIPIDAASQLTEEETVFLESSLP